MKRFAAVALLVAWFALPVCAQRGGGHGGGLGGHFSGGFHGGFSGRAAGGFRGRFAGPRFSAPRYSGRFAARPYGFYSRPGYGTHTNRNYNGYNYNYNRNHAGFRAPYRREGQGARRYRSPYFSGYGFPFFVYGLPDWIGIGPLGCYPDVEVYGDDDEDDYGPWCDQPLGPDTNQPAIYGNDGYYGDDGSGSPEYAPAISPPDYAPPPPPDRTPQARPKAPANEIVTTIVFNDGRPAEQVHNYALTPSMLYVLDARKQDIPVGQINLAATVKVNRAAGIEFQVPVSAQ
jgi:hypothetical protein